MLDSSTIELLKSEFHRTEVNRKVQDQKKNWLSSFTKRKSFFYNRSKQFCIILKTKKKRKVIYGMKQKYYCICTKNFLLKSL